MKTKRTLFSIVAFLSVFWISILLGFNTSLHKKADEQVNENSNIYTDNKAYITSFEARLNALSNNYGSVASISDRLYKSDKFDTDSQTDPHPPIEELEAQEESVESADISAISTIKRLAMFIDEASLTEEDIIHDKETNILPSVYSDIGISIASSYVNIRDEATTESKINGKLYKDSAARILDEVGDWYYIESGSVKGYIMTNYIKTGIPDEELIEKYGRLRISVNTDGLNVRENPNLESDKLTVIYNNEIYPVIDLNDEWIKVDITDDRIIGYVSRDYVELLVDFEKAVSKEEEEELRKLQEEERIKKETEVKYRDEVDYTQDELKLLASLVHAEAGNQSYEGKLAVANIVLNRVKSRKYPNTIKAVIYQPGQFTVANSGSLAKQLDKYESYSSKSQLLTIKAAKAALSGANNIGSRLYFNAYKSAVNKGYDRKKNSVKIEDHLFW
ncbi:MAG: cell wall hydrolase [Anaerolineaceae bacterium]|nr:MAG: cell wall hydrolase [Anaerolineaceae bacterium]